jgi:hypothetical protein
MSHRRGNYPQTCGHLVDKLAAELAASSPEAASHLRHAARILEGEVEMQHRTRAPFEEANRPATRPVQGHIDYHKHLQGMRLLEQQLVAAQVRELIRAQHEGHTIESSGGQKPMDNSSSGAETPVSEPSDSDPLTPPDSPVSSTAFPQ